MTEACAKTDGISTHGLNFCSLLTSLTVASYLFFSLSIHFVITSESSTTDIVPRIHLRIDLVPQRLLGFLLNT